MGGTAYCFDLDGTVTREEILPVLSRQVGLYEEIAALTEATIKGVISFKRSFLLRCRLLADIPLSTVHEIMDTIKMNEEIVSFIKANKSRCVIITGNLDVWIRPMAEKLGCRFFQSNASTAGDRMTGVDHVLNKGDAVKELRREYDRIVAIGDGMGDVQMFEQSDIRIAFGGVHPPIQSLLKLSDYVTYDETSLCRLLSTQ